MKLKFQGRVVAVYVPESVTASRVPVTVVLSGVVWPAPIGEYKAVGVDPSNVHELSGWRCTYWLPADDVEATVMMLRSAASGRGTLEAEISHRLITRQRPSPKDPAKTINVTEWVDSIGYID